MFLSLGYGPVSDPEKDSETSVETHSTPFTVSDEMFLGSRGFSLPRGGVGVTSVQGLRWT